jgi:hypothetical protein
LGFDVIAKLTKKKRKSQLETFARRNILIQIKAKYFLNRSPAGAG